MQIKMNQLRPGDEALILGYEKEGKNYREKLMAMGLTKKEIITLVKAAPLGDPVEILVRGYSLSLRKEEAEILILEKK
jgi:ferrous iron transport protein A